MTTTRKFTFAQFLKIIELAAEKLYAGLDLGVAVERVVVDHLSGSKDLETDSQTRLLMSLDYLKQFIELFKNPDMVSRRAQVSLLMYMNVRRPIYSSD